LHLVFLWFPEFVLHFKEFVVEKIWTGVLLLELLVGCVTFAEARSIGFLFNMTVFSWIKTEIFFISQNSFSCFFSLFSKFSKLKFLFFLVCHLDNISSNLHLLYLLRILKFKIRLHQSQPYNSRILDDIILLIFGLNSR